MKTELVLCAKCGKSFEKSSKEIKRSVKLEREQFCSRSCAGKNMVNLIHLRKIQPGASHLTPNNRRDIYTSFRPHLLRAKRRDKNSSIDLEDLKQAWEEQEGICPYSKVKLISVSRTGRNNPIYSMSLDRKNSSLGYIKGNVQFISIAMNLMKNSMSEEEMQELLLILKYSVKV